MQELFRDEKYKLKTDLLNQFSLKNNLKSNYNYICGSGYLGHYRK